MADRDTAGNGDTAWDAVVIGGGPAGLSAATWLGRYRRRTLLLDAGRPRNRDVELTHGYLTRDGAAPGTLRGAAIADLHAYPSVEHREAEVAAVRGEKERFTIELVDGSMVAARRIVLATGVTDVLPEVENFAEHYGANAFHCPACDGYETRRCEVVVIGWSEEVAGFAVELLDWASSVTILTNGMRFEGDDAHRSALERRGVALLEEDARRLVGTRGDLRAVVVGDGVELPAQYVFFTIGHEPGATLAEALGCRLTDEGCIDVDDQAETTVAGVYAAGDMTPGLHLVQVAAAKGTVAGVACALSLRPDTTLVERPEAAGWDRTGRAGSPPST